MTDEFEPAQLVTHENSDNRYSLILDPYGPIYLTTGSVFEAHGLDESGGYAWHGVVDALVRMRAPEIVDRVKYDPESGMFAAYGNDRDALLRVAQLIREVQHDPDLLEKAIADADPELLD
jgi:hypothetical protein